MSSGTLWRPLRVFFILLLELLRAAIPVAVNVRDTAVLSCNSTCNQEILWTFFEANSKNLEVLRCLQDNCTEGDGFKGRASLSSENMSLTIHPVLFNDQGWYEASCGSKFSCSVHLEVFVPSAVNASVGDNVTLPCYARTEKRIVDEDVNILWQREEQMVVEVKNGIVHYGSGFEERSSVSLNHYKAGDLSLNISRVTPSDIGLYLCYHKSDKQGHPGAVQLTVKAHKSSYEKKVGDELTLNLFSLDNVKVTFTDSEGVEIPVCGVHRGTSTCDPKYNHRVSIMNDSLVLSELSSSDNGKFTVKDNMDKIISVCTVTVKDVEQRHYLISGVIISVFVVVVIVVIPGLFLLCQCLRKSDQRQIPVYFNARQSELEPLREPANIGLSQEETSQGILEQQEETSQGISEQPDVVHTPVEETSPEIGIITEKQEEAFDGLENE
ncbi:uncharacterized protein [Misgurnus anguillicaudatus]|uniref:uncharacterized protein n=1 Tax=Misgurnus anguillicaudatus TaxID=75329 RepID=UPI003CCF163B